ncbi:MAG: VanZ family protein [Rubrivivax sp.]|nr:MAG: VanZ family protein [Rubrivivax sp.]
MNRLLSLFTAPERRLLWRALLGLLLVVITFLALSPAPPKTVDLGWDKANHALAFGSLAFSAVWALWPQPRRWGWLVLALLAYGIGIEIAQSFLPPREADWHDVVADSLGIALGLLAAWPISWLSRAAAGAAAD